MRRSCLDKGHRAAGQSDCVPTTSYRTGTDERSRAVCANGHGCEIHGSRAPTSHSQDDSSPRSRSPLAGCSAWCACSRPHPQPWPSDVPNRSFENSGRSPTCSTIGRPLMLDWHRPRSPGQTYDTSHAPSFRRSSIWCQSEVTVVRSSPVHSPEPVLVAGFGGFRGRSQSLQIRPPARPLSVPLPVKTRVALLG
jgi:hypothetical protein